MDLKQALLDYLSRSATPATPVPMATVTGHRDLSPAIDYYKGAGNQFLEGGKDIYNGDVSRGGNKLFDSIGKATAPLAVPAVMSNPGSALMTMLAAGLFANGTKRGLTYAGMKPEQAELGANLASVFIPGGNNYKKTRWFIEQKRRNPRGIWEYNPYELLDNDRIPTVPANKNETHPWTPTAEDLWRLFRIKSDDPNFVRWRAKAIENSSRRKQRAEAKLHPTMDHDPLKEPRTKIDDDEFMKYFGLK